MRPVSNTDFTSAKINNLTASLSTHFDYKTPSFDIRAKNKK